MSLWVRFMAVNKKGTEKMLGDRWQSQHTSLTPADPEDENEECSIEIELDQLPPNTTKIKVEFIP